MIQFPDLGRDFGPLSTSGIGGNGAAATTQASPTDGDSFAWGGVTIGAASMAGTILFGLAALAVTRQKRVPNF